MLSQNAEIISTKANVSKVIYRIGIFRYQNTLHRKLHDPRIKRAANFPERGRIQIRINYEAVLLPPIDGKFPAGSYSTLKRFGANLILCDSRTLNTRESAASN
jgi:hypothetical protein